MTWEQGYNDDMFSYKSLDSVHSRCEIHMVIIIMSMKKVKQLMCMHVNQRQ